MRDRNYGHTPQAPESLFETVTRWGKYYTMAVVYTLVTFVLTGFLVAALPASLTFAPIIAWCLGVYVVSRWARSRAQAV